MNVQFGFKVTEGMELSLKDEMAVIRFEEKDKLRVGVLYVNIPPSVQLHGKNERYVNLESEAAPGDYAEVRVLPYRLELYVNGVLPVILRKQSGNA